MSESAASLEKAKNSLNQIGSMRLEGETLLTNGVP